MKENDWFLIAGVALAGYFLYKKTSSIFPEMTEGIGGWEEKIVSTFKKWINPVMKQFGLSDISSEETIQISPTLTDYYVAAARGMLPLTPEQKTARWTAIYPPGTFSLEEIEKILATGKVFTQPGDPYGLYTDLDTAINALSSGAVTPTSGVVTPTGPRESTAPALLASIAEADPTTKWITTDNVSQLVSGDVQSGYRWVYDVYGRGYYTRYPLIWLSGDVYASVEQLLQIRPYYDEPYAPPKLTVSGGLSLEGAYPEQYAQALAYYQAGW